MSIIKSLRNVLIGTVILASTTTVANAEELASTEDLAILMQVLLHNLSEAELQALEEDITTTQKEDLAAERQQAIAKQIELAKKQYTRQEQLERIQQEIQLLRLLQGEVLKQLQKKRIGSAAFNELFGMHIELTLEINRLQTEAIHLQLVINVFNAANLAKTLSKNLN